MKYRQQITAEYESLEVRNDPISKTPQGRAALLRKPPTFTIPPVSTDRAITRPIHVGQLRVLTNLCKILGR